MRPAVFLAVLLAAALSAAAAIAQEVHGDPAAGAQVFRKCGACHSLEPGQNKVGPSLAGIFGRKAGTIEGYDYSVALKRSGVTWTPETIDQFLASPSHFIHGSKMLFTGLKRPEDRANVIAYIAQRLARQAEAAQPAAQPSMPHAMPQAGAPAAQTAVAAATSQPAPAGYSADVRYTLKSGIAEGRLVFIGIGGDIDGVVNPPLSAREGQVVQVTLINGEGAEHDIVFPDFNVRSQRVVGRGASTTVAFRAGATGDFVYFCSLPGHREAGMEGRLTVLPAGPPPAAETERDISMDPAKLPVPIGRRQPQRVEVALESIELEGKLADGTTYTYWTFNGTVPGPFIRVRVGDTVAVTLRNDPDATMIHSVDFHAATGPGGGAVYTQVDPGAEKRIEFKALKPGLYVYHCATPMVAHHIANGMYGLILVEPEEGLPPVDKEFYVMQGEIYTEQPFGQHGMQEFSVTKLLDEKAEYIVFNGSVGALTHAHPLQAKVGETVRLFIGVGGPNYSSSFHVIGEIFDRVYVWGDVVSPSGKAIQTVTVPPGGAAIVEFKLDFPGRYLLVDHALSRMERGLVGFLNVEGQADPGIFRAFSEPSEVIP